MKLNDKYISRAIIFSVTIILCGILFYPTLYKYEKVKWNDKELIVKINRVTGKSEWFYNGVWYPSVTWKPSTENQ